MLTVADTAFAIAAVRAEESAHPAPLFEDPYAAAFRAAGAAAEEGTQRFLNLPFFRDGIRVRTRFIDDEVRAALAAGVEQLVLLGAGFDTRGLRFAVPRVFELDLAEQLARKRQILGDVPRGIAYVACDLASESFVDVLARHGFDRERPALIVWEGVTTYIGVAATERTLRAIAALEHARVVFDLATRFFSPDSNASRIAACGLACETYGADTLVRRYIKNVPPPGAETFQLVVAACSLSSRC